MMVILAATISGQAMYFRGSAHAFEWSKDRAQAARYDTEAAARADLIGSPMAYTHLVMRAQAVPDATPGATPAGVK